MSFFKKSSSDYLKDGVKKTQLNDLDGAIQAFSRAIDIDPSNAMAYNNRGICKMQKGDLENSILDLKKASSLGLSEASELLGKINIEDKNKIKFVSNDDFNEITSQDNQLNSAMEEYNKGVTASRNNEPLQALAHYDKAIKLNPNFIDALYNRGSIYYHLENYDTEALADYNKVISIDPTHAAAYHNRGMVKYYMGDNMGACRDFKKAIELGETVYAVNSYNQFCK